MTLPETARMFMKDGKGILDLSQSPEILHALFSAYHISDSDESLHAYYELVATTAGIERNISAVCLSESAMRTKLPNGTPFYHAFLEKNILIGVSFDAGVSEKKLEQSVREFRSLALSFVMLTVYVDVNGTPADQTLRDTIRNAAEAAKFLQSESILPVIVLTVSMQGAHTAGQSEDHLIELLSLMSDTLESGSIDLKSLILGVSFASPGAQNPTSAPASEVSERTVRALTSSTPKTLGGVVFVSGIESPEEGARIMNAIARKEPFPWSVTFLSGSSLHAVILEAWKGSEGNRVEAQALLSRRLAVAVAADTGGYSKEMEKI